MKAPQLRGFTLFASLAVITLVVYSPLYGAGFVTDFLGWIDCEQDTPLFRSHLCFQNRGLYYVPFIALSILSDLFSYQALPWFIAFVGLHALNGYLVARLVGVLHTLFGLTASRWIPLAAAMVFIFYPYQVEVVAWKACINYLTTGTLILLTITYYIKWWRNGQSKWYWLAFVLFILSLFNLEFAVLLPVLLFGMHLLLPGQDAFNLRRRQAIVGVLPFIGAVVFFFLINRIFIGKAIGHYAVDVSAFSPLALASVEMKYAFKILCFGRLWPYGTQDMIYTTLSSPIVGGLALAALLGFGGWVLYNKKHLGSRLLLRTFLLFGAVLFILPIAHLYFYYLQFSENDRYTYFAMIFISIGLPVLFGGWKRFGRVFLALYVVAALGSTVFFNNLWRQSHNVHEHLAETFKWHDNSEVYILNLPDNLRGIFMFRNIGGDSAFEEVLTLLKKKPFTGKIYDIYQYNMATAKDGVSVSKLDQSQYQVTFNQWGNWWWRNGIGGTNYKTDKYSARINGQSFTVDFNDIAPDAAIIYFDGSEWQETN